MSPKAINKQPKLTKKDLEAQLAQLTVALQRERADAENVRRRATIDRDRDRQLVRRDTIVQLLPVIDNLQLAFSQSPAELAGNQWVAGILMIDQQLGRSLIELGLLPIETVGQPFDPNLMEAVEIVPTNDQPEQTVVVEVVRGYLWGDEVLRIAQVKVAVKPKDSSDS